MGMKGTIYRACRSAERKYGNHNKNTDPSGTIAVISVIGGLILEALICLLLDIEIDDVPTFLLMIGWFVCMFIVFAILNFLCEL